MIYCDIIGLNWYNTERVVMFFSYFFVSYRIRYTCFNIKSFVIASNLTLNTSNAFEKALIYLKLLNVELYLVCIAILYKYKTTKEINKYFDEFS